MTTFEYKNHLITEEDDFLWDLLDERMFSDENVDNRIFGNWED